MNLQQKIDAINAASSLEEIIALLQPQEFSLTTYSQEDLEAAEKLKEDAARAEAEADAKFAAAQDTTPFVLTGSDSKIDTAEAHGQGNMFDMPEPKERESDRQYIIDNYQQIVADLIAEADKEITIASKRTVKKSIDVIKIRQEVGKKHNLKMTGWDDADVIIGKALLPALFSGVSGNGKISRQEKLSSIEPALREALGLDSVNTNNPDLPQSDEITPEGKEYGVRTAKGTRVSTTFSVIEANDLIASHSIDGKVNPRFPQELQPRDRSRATSQIWIKKVSSDLDPGLLGKTKKADSGAPIIGTDKIVESGNGRALAIIEAYKSGHAEEYRQMIIEDAESFGLDPAKVTNMVAPVLVRVRTGNELDRRTFAIEANQDDKLAMTATEKARSDSLYLTPTLLDSFNPSEDGDMMAVSNREFIQGFLKQIGDAEAAQYTTSIGEPTGALINRIQAAIFSKAYDDERLLELMADTAKPENRNLINALSAAAPQFIQARAINELMTQEATNDIGAAVKASLDNEAVTALVDATNIVRQAKRDGMTVDEYVSQMGLFSELDAGVAAMAIFIAQNNRSSKRMAMAFKSMAEFVKSEIERSTTIDIFGDSQPVSLRDIVYAANKALEAEYGEDTNTKINFSGGDNGGLFESVKSAKDLNTLIANQLKGAKPATQKQHDAGNYKKAHLTIHGLSVAIENPKGSTRAGVDPDGQAWSITMPYHYGYIKKTNGADGDEVDVYVGNNPESELVFIVDQVNQGSGDFDEHKVMIGFTDQVSASKAYSDAYTKNWQVGKITQLTIEQFKAWLGGGDTKSNAADATILDPLSARLEAIRQKATARRF